MLAESPYHMTSDQVPVSTLAQSKPANELAPSGSIKRKPMPCVYAQMSMAGSVCVRWRERIT